MKCAQGFRIIQLLKKFDINDEVNVYEEDEHEDLDLNLDKSNFVKYHDPSTQNTNEITNSNENGNKKSTKIENNKIIYFLDHIYKNCKRLNITPNIVIEWIEDLLSSFHDFATESDKDNDCNDTISSGINNAVEKKENDRNIRKEIPFLSSVTFYIEQKKKRIRHLENIKISISKEIDVLTKQRQDIAHNLNKTIEAEKKVSSYFRWYEKLKQELFYEHTILIEH